MRHAAGTVEAKPLGYGAWSRPRWRGICACGWSSTRTLYRGDALRWALDHIFYGTG
jgi:hypothetical protein